MVSSLPLASHLPEWVQRTVRTGPACILSVERWVGNPLSRAASFRIGLVDHIRIFASENLSDTMRVQS